ncbi:unnamed protein product, partial [Allacma fusca]
MWNSLLMMESPLDILSRAAGMVSRNHEVNGSSNNSTNSHDSQCRILKLALVSSNGHNGIINSSNNKEGQSPKQGYEHSLDMTPPPESRASPDVTNGMDSDTPLDMSIKKPKRKIEDSDQDDTTGSTGTDEDKVKRKRPSVISYASHQANNVTGFDVDDHFKKSLGLESYNSVFSNNVFSNNAKSTSSTPADGSPVPASDDSTHEEEKLKSSSTNSKAKMVQQSSDLENSVDDHFAKALGKSTWMKLQ